MPQNTVELARRFLRGAVLVVIVLAIAKAVSIYIIGRLDDAAARFTLRRIEHLSSRLGHRRHRDRCSVC